MLGRPAGGRYAGVLFTDANIDGCDPPSASGWALTVLDLRNGSQLFQDQQLDDVALRRGDRVILVGDAAHWSTYGPFHVAVFDLRSRRISFDRIYLPDLPTLPKTRTWRATIVPRNMRSRARPCSCKSKAPDDPLRTRILGRRILGRTA